MGCLLGAGRSWEDTPWPGDLGQGYTTWATSSHNPPFLHFWGTLPAQEALNHWTSETGDMRAVLDLTLPHFLHFWVLCLSGPLNHWTSETGVPRWLYASFFTVLEGPRRLPGSFFTVLEGPRRPPCSFFTVLEGPRRPPSLF